MQSRHFQAATRLEQLWNRLLEQSSFQLFCGYHLDILNTECPTAFLEELLATHSHVLPDNETAEQDPELRQAIQQVLGSSAFDPFQPGSPSGAITPYAERTRLWLRMHHPLRVNEIAKRRRRIATGKSR